MNVAVSTISAAGAHLVPTMRSFTVDEYHRMVQSGILGEDDPVELLEGWIVLKMPHNPQHDTTVKLVEKALSSRLAREWHTRTQSAITLDDSEPEPDVVVVAGDVREYGARHPGPKDIALVVEVADSSLHHDRISKARIYARNGIPGYWIMNLTDGVVEAYSDPSGPHAQPAYGRKEHFARGQRISVPLMTQSIELPVDELLL